MAWKLSVFYTMYLFCYINNIDTYYMQTVSLRFVMSFGFKIMNHKNGIINWHGVVLKHKVNFVSGICISWLAGNSDGRNPCLKWKHLKKGITFYS